MCGVTFALKLFGTAQKVVHVCVWSPLGCDCLVQHRLQKVSAGVCGHIWAVVIWHR